MVSAFLGSFALLLMIGDVNAKEVTYEWDLVPVIDNAYSPDCMNVVAARRTMFLAEKSFPGPMIEADEGDIIKVRINNLSPSVATSIHFHGLHQKGSPYSDGSAFITQCALGPLQSQEYVFNAYPSGTHYWHDHTSYNIADGISGPIIIHPKDPEPFTYDEEQIIFLQDWYMVSGLQQYDGLISWPFIWIGDPNSLLINGKGIAPECQLFGSNYNNSNLCLETCVGKNPSDLLSKINVTEGKTYRLRLINSGQLVLMNFAIANHTMTIVQVEGTNVKPVSVESLDIATGQRYDVIVVANQVPGSYWIETAVRDAELPNLKGLAIFQYEGATLQIDEPPAHPAWNDTAFGIEQDLSLKSMNVTNFPAASALTATNVKRYLMVGTINLQFVDNAPQLVRMAMNNVSNTRGSQLLISKAFESAQRNLVWPAPVDGTVEIPNIPPVIWNYTTDQPDGVGGPGPSLGSLAESVMLLNSGDVVEIVYQNSIELNGIISSHPFHMHGHSFFVVGLGEGVYDPDKDVANYNLVDPVFRDTVVVHPLGWVAIRFLADNPGVWLFHCHVVAHSMLGMSVNMIVQPDALAANPPPSISSCSNQQFGGNSSDINTTTNDSVGDETSGANDYYTNICMWATTSFIALIILFSYN